MTRQQNVATGLLWAATTFLSTSATAVTVEVTVENLMQPEGGVITPVWVALHDGSFDTFTPGSAASSGIEHLAEDAIIGLEPTIPGFVETALSLGLNPSVLASFGPSIAAQFAASSAGINAGTQGIIADSPVGLVPGAVLSTRLEIGDDLSNSAFLSFAAMFIPSNDAFIADAAPVSLLNDDGDLISADFIITGNQIWDAGTEVNDENPANIPLSLANVGNGVDEGGVVAQHPGLATPGSGGILDVGFPNGDFTADGFQVARISVRQVRQVPEPTVATMLLLGLAGGSAARRLGKLRRA